MPTPAPLQPQESELSRYVVGEPVSARHGARWASQVAHLLGRHGHRVCSHNVQPLAARTASIKTVQVQYLRSQIAKVALVAVELRDDYAITGATRLIPQGYRVTVTATAPSGATWIDRDQLDGVAQIMLPNPGLAGRKWLYGLLDVSGCSSTSISTLKIDIQGVSTETHLGLGCVQLLELPLASVRPEDGENGLLISWCDPRNWLEQGPAATGPRGFSALVDIEQKCATRLRWWWQLLGYEDASVSTSGDSWFVTGSMAALNWRGSVTTTFSPLFRTRVRRIHDGSAIVDFRVRYLAASGGKVRFVVTPVGGSATNFDVTCSSSASWTTAALTAQSIPTTGTDQMVEIELKAEGTAGSTIYVSNATIHSAEVA